MKKNSKKKKISLMFVNYNGRAHLDEYLTSVFSQTMRPDEVIMFDNLCKDGSRDFVRKKFPKVKIIIEDGFNTGTALAYNRAFAQTTGDYVILQANDLVLDKNCVKILYQTLEKNPKAAIATSITIRYSNWKLKKFIVDQAGGHLDMYGFGMQNYPEVPVKDIPATGEVFFAYGDSFMMRREVYEKVNGLDTRMYMLNDDLDLCWRMRQLGYKILYNKHSFVYHKGSATIKINFDRPRVRYLSERNSIRSYIKNTSYGHFFKTLPMYILLLCGEMGYFFYRGKFSLFFSDVRAVLWNLLYLPETLYLKIGNQMNVKKNNIDKLIVRKSFKLMLFKNFSKSI